MKRKFDYGNFLIEYRHNRGEILHFLKKKILSIDEALKESDKLKNNGYADVIIRKNEIRRND